MLLLRSIIRQMLIERFNVGLNDLRSLKSTEELKAFFKELNIKPLGCGSTRCAYAINASKVAKIAQNEHGQRQNLAEVDAYTNPNARDILAKIYDADDEGLWVVSEMVREFRTTEEFERAVGIPWQHFDDLIIVMSQQRVEEITLARSRSSKQKRPIEIRSIDQLPTHTRNWMSNVILTMKTLRLSPNDLRSYDHWGLTKEGRVVLLDYGLIQTNAY